MLKTTEEARTVELGKLAFTKMLLDCLLITSDNEVIVMFDLSQLDPERAMWAQETLDRVMPLDEWMAIRPRSATEIEGYHYVVGELRAMITKGH